MGATARIGTVCEATMYGMNPRWSSFDWNRSAPSTKPTVAPSANPITASFAVKSAAFSRTVISSGPLTRDGSNRALTIERRLGIVMSSTTNGRVQWKWIPSQR